MAGVLIMALVSAMVVGCLEWPSVLHPVAEAPLSFLNRLMSLMSVVPSVALVTAIRATTARYRAFRHDLPLSNPTPGGVDMSTEYTFLRNCQRCY